jgi:hypothetical protein
MSRLVMMELKKFSLGDACSWPGLSCLVQNETGRQSNKGKKGGEARQTMAD